MSSPSPAEPPPKPLVAVLNHFVASGLMPDPRGLCVWDLGCGTGVFCEAFVELGARRVIGSDLTLHAPLPVGPSLEFVRGGIAEVEAQAGPLAEVDQVFMHLMSEHVSDWAQLMRDLHARLAPGALVLVHHDNYYSPTGIHDHGLVAFDPPSWAAQPQGPRCWESEQRCAASEERRAVLRQHWPAQWSADSESTKNPADCSSCNYFRRSQLWGHLLYGASLQETFPETFFKDELNRLTPSQLVWSAKDAGFALEHEVRVWLHNEVPESLALEYGANTLRLFTTTLRLRRR